MRVLRVPIAAARKFSVERLVVRVHARWRGRRRRSGRLGRTPGDHDGRSRRYLVIRERNSGSSSGSGWGRARTRPVLGFELGFGRKCGLRFDFVRLHLYTNFVEHGSSGGRGPQCGIELVLERSHR